MCDPNICAALSMFLIVVLVLVVVIGVVLAMLVDDLDWAVIADINVLVWTDVASGECAGGGMVVVMGLVLFLGLEVGVTCCDVALVVSFVVLFIGSVMVFVLVVICFVVVFILVVLLFVMIVLMVSVFMVVVVVFA